ncbi:MAG: hypothetical protein EBU93_08120, partial [Chlamydiae bacterium]|nr:hypothetical protein [Chlamydiota bacterium]
TLEHLGDSILGATVSTYLFKRFPLQNEGFLTDLKKDIVCNGRTNTKKLGDILEAFIGALWTDSDNNFDVIYSFIKEIIETHINIPKLLLNNRNFKEQLQKFYQAKFHQTPKYIMLSSAANMYMMAAVDEKNIHLGIGSAPTKKQAEQIAAKEALKNLKVS